MFTSGDIAKQMPMEAKKFAHMDRDWQRIMIKSAEVRGVLDCCDNDILKQLLPNLQAGLEACQVGI